MTDITIFQKLRAIAILYTVLLDVVVKKIQVVVDGIMEAVAQEGVPAREEGEVREGLLFYLMTNKRGRITLMVSMIRMQSEKLSLTTY